MNVLALSEHSHSLQLPKRPLPTARDLAGAIFRQKKIVFTLALLILAVGTLYIATFPRYQSEAVFLLERDRVDPMVTPEQNSNTQLLHDSITEEQVNNEAKLLRSDDLLRQVVIRCGLVDNSSGKSASESEDMRIARAVKALNQRLSVTALRKTNMIVASYVAKDPEQAKRVLQTVTDLYLAKHAEVHRPGGQVEFFERQADKYRQGLEAAKSELAKFTARTHVVSAATERDGTLQQRITFSQNLANIEADIQRLKQRIASVQQQMATMHPRMVTQEKKGDNGMLLEQLKSTLLQQQLKKTQLLAIYQPSYRLVQDIDKEIAQTQQAIERELAAPVTERVTDQDPGYELLREDLLRTKAELASNEAKASALRTTVEQYQKEAQALNERDLQQSSLQQEEKLQEANYVLYAQKAEEARITAALDARHIVNVVVAQPASTPALPRRNIPALAVLTLIAATVFSFGFGFIADLADPTFQHPAQIQSVLGVPVLVSIPSAANRASMYKFTNRLRRQS
jgi:polysaccharide biosynthesis transport protein